MTKQLKTVIIIGLGAEVITMVMLWGFAPTDTVRGWYPSLAVYIAEYLAVWILLAGVLFLLVGAMASRRGAVLVQRPYLRCLAAATVLTALDMAAALLLWPWRSTLWDGSIGEMAEARLTAFVPALTLVAILFWMMKKLFGLLRAQHHPPT